MPRLLCCWFALTLLARAQSALAGGEAGAEDIRELCAGGDNIGSG